MRTRVLLCLMLVGPYGLHDAIAQAPNQSQPLPYHPRPNLGVGIEVARAPEYFLLDSPVIALELKLDGKQKERLSQLKKEGIDYVKSAEMKPRARVEEYRNARSKLGLPYDPQVLSAIGEEARAAKMEALSRIASAYRGVLTKGQRSRLKEIQLQLEGPVAFTRPEVQEVLNMDEFQCELISNIVNQEREKVNEVATRAAPDLTPGTPRSTPEQRKTLAESESYKSALAKARNSATGARQEAMKAIAKVLTRKQRAKYEKMLGAPFDAASLRGKPTPARKGVELDK